MVCAEAFPGYTSESDLYLAESDAVPLCLYTSSFSNWPIISKHLTKQKHHTDRLRFNWPRSPFLSLYLGFSLHRSPHGISLAGPPVKILPLPVSAFPQPALPCLDRTAVAGVGWDGSPTPKLVPSYCYDSQPTTHSTSR